MQQGFSAIVGGEDYGALALDGKDHWQGLRVVTPRGWMCCMMKKGKLLLGDCEGKSGCIKRLAFEDCTKLTSVTLPRRIDRHL